MKLISMGTGAAVFFGASLAAAQGGLDVSAEAEASTEDGASGDAVALEETEEPVALDEEPAAEPPPPAPAAEDSGSTSEAETEEPSGASDHEKMVGRFAVGYMGRQSITVGALDGSGVTINAPIIGARYWLDPMMGIDAGLGFNMAGSKTKVTDNDAVKDAGVTAVLLHVGVPLSLAHTGHFSFQVVPEANIGFGGTGDADPADDSSLTGSGLHISAGARAGAEIHFGFMDVPQLSLQGSVGLYFQSESAGTKATPAMGDAVKTTQSAMTLGTSLGPDPWDIFTSNINALYYF